MTIKELKKLIANIDDNVLIFVKNDCGEYDYAEGGYEDTEEYWETYTSYYEGKEPKQRKVFYIF